MKIMCVSPTQTGGQNDPLEIFLEIQNISPGLEIVQSTLSKTKISCKFDKNLLM